MIFCDGFLCLDEGQFLVVNLSCNSGNLFNASLCLHFDCLEVYKIVKGGILRICVIDSSSGQFYWQTIQKVVMLRVMLGPSMRNNIPESPSLKRYSEEAFQLYVTNVILSKRLDNKCLFREATLGYCSSSKDPTYVYNI